MEADSLHLIRQPAFGHGAAIARLVQFSGALAVAQTNLSPEALRESMNSVRSLSSQSDRGWMLMK